MEKILESEAEKLDYVNIKNVFFRVNKRVFVCGKVTNRMQMRVRFADSICYCGTEFCCGVDILKVEGEYNTVVSNIGICGYSLTDFVFHYFDCYDKRKAKYVVFYDDPASDNEMNSIPNKDVSNENILRDCAEMIPDFDWMHSEERLEYEKNLLEKFKKSLSK